MEMEPRDTIAACATASGAGGVAIVRLSGPAALAVATVVTGRAVTAWPERRLVRVRLRDAAGARLDDGLGVAMRGPRSFTGEDVVELHVHGGAVNVGAVLGAVVAAGARLAEPGEFTRRALAAGKLSVAEAEALLAVVTAPSTRAWALAQEQLGGALTRAVRGLRDRASGVLATLDAMLDFPEDGLAPADRDALIAELAAVSAGAASLERSFVAARALGDGLVVALVGAVNAGKSSLLNALVGEERVLVSEEPGTTRDYVEVRTIWDGVAVTLVDTAGERAAAAGLEERGIALGRRRAARADVVVRVVGPDDVGEGGGEVVGGEARGEAVGDELRVASKVDLGWGPGPALLPTSAVTGAGVAELRRAIVARVGLAEDVEAGSAVLLTERQRAAAATARAAADAGAGALRAGRPLELAALDVRAAATALAALEGESVGEEILDELFARFCIGK